MTEKILVIGAPSLTGKDANALARELFADSEYPLEVIATNSAPFNLSLPEARLSLKPLATEQVAFADFSRLQRAVSSLSQIAELNKMPVLATFKVDAGEGQAEDEGDGGTDGGGDGGGGEQPGAVVVTVVQDDGTTYVVELNGIRFEPNRNQVRDDGTLTAGGVKAYEAAKAKAAAESN
ncbi:hypothetical protein D9M69_465920 [compost metagenome]